MHATRPFNPANLHTVPTNRAPAYDAIDLALLGALTEDPRGSYVALAETAIAAVSG